MLHGEPLETEQRESLSLESVQLIAHCLSWNTPSLLTAQMVRCMNSLTSNLALDGQVSRTQLDACIFYFLAITLTMVKARREEIASKEAELRMKTQEEFLCGVKAWCTDQSVVALVTCIVADGRCEMSLSSGHSKKVAMT